MGRILNCGSLRAHDRKLGIQHKYIVKELTIDNWNKRAIVRDGKYIYILKCKCRDSSKSKKKTIYLIDGLSENNTFDTLNEIQHRLAPPMGYEPLRSLRALCAILRHQLRAATHVLRGRWIHHVLHLRGLPSILRVIRQFPQ